jgi:chaperonin cofactor prefoldin
VSDLNLYEEGLLMDLAKAEARIEELEAVLQEVAAWVDDVGHYADDGAVLVPVFRKVKAALGKGYT